MSLNASVGPFDSACRISLVPFLSSSVRNGVMSLALSPARVLRYTSAAYVLCVSAFRSASGISVANFFRTSSARSAYGNLRHISSSAPLTCGYTVGRYRPPSGARPPSRIWEKDCDGDWPRVEMYCIKWNRSGRRKTPIIACCIAANAFCLIR